MKFRDLANEMKRVAGQLESVAAKNPSGSREYEKLRFTVMMLNNIALHVDDYDQNAFSTREWLINNFSAVLESRLTYELSAITRMHEYLARFAREKTLRSGLANGEEQGILNYYRQPNLSIEEQSEADYIWNQLPLHLLETTSKIAIARVEEQSKITSNVTEEIIEANKTLNLVKGWKDEIENWESRVGEYQEILKGLHQQYNFVGLAKAFLDLLDSKRNEKKWQKFWVCLLALAALTPVGCEFYFTMIRTVPQTAGEVSKDFFSAFQDIKWPALISLLGLEVILVYYFRVALLNFQLLRTEILQLELRWSLCAFIEGYINFVKDRKDDISADRLMRFEAMVFSGIDGSVKDIPNALDSIESLATIIKEFRKS